MIKHLLVQRLTWRAKMTGQPTPIRVGQAVPIWPGQNFFWQIGKATARLMRQKPPRCAALVEWEAVSSAIALHETTGTYAGLVNRWVQGTPITAPELTYPVNWVQGFSHGNGAQLLAGIGPDFAPVEMHQELPVPAEKLRLQLQAGRQPAALVGVRELPRFHGVRAEQSAVSLRDVLTALNLAPRPVEELPAVPQYYIEDINGPISLEGPDGRMRRFRQFESTFRPWLGDVEEVGEEFQFEASQDVWIGWHEGASSVLLPEDFGTWRDKERWPQRLAFREFAPKYERKFL
jgi:hypothetical protein